MPSEARKKQIEQRIREIKQEKIKLLQQARDYKQGNLLEFFNRPKEDGGMPANPLQSELLEAWENPGYKVFTYSGANRLGKTTIGAVISFSVMFGKWLWSDKKLWFPHNNPRRVRLVGQDWEKHVKAVVIPELKKWWPKKRKLKGGKPKKNNNGVEYFWEDEATGSTLEVMSNLQDSDLHEGWQGDLVYYDEPCKRDIRVANARGLIDRQGRELFCMTLLKEAWIDREVIKAVDEDGRPDRSVFSVEGDIWQNVGYGITEDGVKDFAKKLTDEEKSARLHGKPSYMMGLVYPQFNRRTHMIERFPIPTNWPVDIALDIHPRERQAVLFVATDPRNERYGCEEIWEHGDGDSIADEILRRISRNDYRVNKIIIDPLSKSTGEAQRGVDENSTFHKIQRKLWQHDYTLEVASKDKTSGVLEVRNHLLGPNKKPSIWFFEDLVRVLFEFEGYMYKDGKIMDEDDHQMENLYRLLLCDTHYVEPDDEEYEDEVSEDVAVNPVTGY